MLGSATCYLLNDAKDQFPPRTQLPYEGVHRLGKDTSNLGVSRVLAGIIPFIVCYEELMWAGELLMEGRFRKGISYGLLVLVVSSLGVGNAI